MLSLRGTVAGPAQTWPGTSLGPIIHFTLKWMKIHFRFCSWSHNYPNNFNMRVSLNDEILEYPAGIFRLFWKKIPPKFTTKSLSLTKDPKKRNFLLFSMFFEFFLQTYVQSMLKITNNVSTRRMVFWMVYKLSCKIILIFVYCIKKKLPKISILTFSHDNLCTIRKISAITLNSWILAPFRISFLG